jgi:uncharacterized protein (TIGR02265 family)
MFRKFSVPNFDRPIDVSDYFKRVPTTATIKGMFLSSLIDTLGSNRSQLPEVRQKYVAFKDYPLVEQVKLVAAVAATLHPKLSLREAIRRVGHTVYPTFSTSLVGKVTFAAVGRDPAALLTAGTKAYKLSSNVGKAEIIKLEERFALLGMRDMYNFIDCYQVGILEGALSVIGLKPTVRIDLENLSSGIFELTW